MKTRNCNYRLEVIVNGRPIREYDHAEKTYVEGRKGSEFTLRIHNDTEREVEAVVTLDGLSVMNGKKGHFGVGGYIVRPYSHLDVPGWRLDNDRVARFYFAHFDEAYASQMGSPENVGVIGCAIFPKREVLIRPQWGKGGLETMGATMRGGIGGGFGRETSHHVHEVQFTRDNPLSPQVVLVIHYGDKQQLTGWGVLPEKTANIAPNPFPGVSEVGFAPPPNWPNRTR